MGQLLPENSTLARRLRRAAQGGALPHAIIFSGSGDRVPELADIGGHVRFLPVGQGTEPWILGLRQAAAAGRTETPVDPEWDIRRAVKRLECYYLEE